MVWKVDFLIFLTFLTWKSVKIGRKKNLFFLKWRNFLRRIRWSYQFFTKIKLNAIFWGLKLKNYGNFRSTNILFWPKNGQKSVEMKIFFFLKWRNFLRRFWWSIWFFAKIKWKPIFWPKMSKIMIFRTSIFGIFDGIMAFSLIFAKIHLDHQILRKKLGI